MALSPFCSNDEVRAALGVSDVELEDATLNLPFYAIGLKSGLERVSKTLPASFSAIAEIAETDRTDQQNRLYESVRLYSIYFVAKQAGGALGLLSVKSLTDNKANFSRFSDSPYESVMESIDAALSAAKIGLQEVLAEMSNDAVRAYNPVGFFAVKRLYDPVTGG